MWYSSFKRYGRRAQTAVLHAESMVEQICAKPFARMFREVVRHLDLRELSAVVNGVERRR